MKLAHIAIWTQQLELLKEFYTTYFKAASNEKYTSDKGSRGTFESYFLSFDGDARLELMSLPAVPHSGNTDGAEATGLTHIAFALDSPQELDSLYYTMKEAGLTVASERRITGDNYYEFCVLDPDGNRVEVTAPPTMNTVNLIIDKFDKPFLSVDYNELIAQDMILLSQTDLRTDYFNAPVYLYDGLEVVVYEEDSDIHGIRNDIIAEGLCTRNTTGISPHVDWVIKINEKGIRYVSDIIKEQLEEGEPQHV